MGRNTGMILFGRYRAIEKQVSLNVLEKPTSIVRWFNVNLLQDAEFFSVNKEMFLGYGVGVFPFFL
jgi:hypothetical protein